MLFGIWHWNLTYRRQRCLNAAEKWKKFTLAYIWNNYSLGTELNRKLEAVEVATLLTVREEACDVYSIFMDWAEEGDWNNFSN